MAPGVVLVCGPNGAGKTNLLEALHVGTQGFSPRTRSDAQLVRFGAQSARVRLRGVRGPRGFETDVVLHASEGRRVRVNGTVLRSGEQLRQELRTLVFTPDRLAVVKGSPAVRRAYLDRVLSRLLPARAALPGEYLAVVGQRNAGLRRAAAGLSPREALAPWTQAAAALGAELVQARRDTLEALAEPFARCAEALGLLEAELVYEGEPASVEEHERRLQRDLERGATGLGPHLHDLRIAARGRDLRAFGSQGEQRIAVLALVLAEAEALAERSGQRPLLLLDDVLSELDGERRLALARLLARGGQTIVTATAAAAFPGQPAQRLAVSRGRVAEAA